MKFIQIISRDGKDYSINLSNVVNVAKLDPGNMFITFVHGDGLYTKTTYDEFLKLTGQNNESIYNSPNQEFQM